MATITFQNYFRLYDKLSGMTGTAMTEQEEFYKIYGLEVVAIPTHRPMVRDNRADLVFRDEEAKFNAVIEEIADMQEAGRPVLVGLSRKRTIGVTLARPEAPVEARLFGTLGATAVAVLRGATLVRTHDVRPTVEMLRVLAATTTAFISKS